MKKQPVIGPMPVIRRQKPSPLRRLVDGRRSALDVLFERSYSMMMGEFRGLWRRYYFLNQPEHVSRILDADVDLYPKSDLMSTFLSQILGNGVFVSNGAAWKRQRKMMNTAFELARVSEAFGQMVKSVESMGERLDQVADGREVAIDMEMSHVTADIIFRTIFSEPLEREEAETVFRAFNQYQELAYVHGVWAMAGLPQALSLARLRAIRFARAIRGPLERLVRKRLDLLATDPAEPPRDILASLMAARDDHGKGFTERELVDQIAVVFLAGHETSASALSWTLYLVARDPDVQARMQAEADAVYGGGKSLQMSDFRKLKLTRDAFREGLRLYPPVSFVPRDITVPETIRGKHLGKGSAVFVPIWLMHRHRQIWKNPDVFDPDRFSRADEKDAIRSAYLPFSQGPRVCLGASFAMQEAAIIMSYIARRYEMEAIDSRVPQPVSRLTLRSHNGVWLRLRRRRHDDV